MAILLFVAALVLGFTASLVPIAYATGRRRGRRESADAARRDLLDRAERFSYGDTDRERELVKAMLALLAGSDRHV